MKLLKGVLVLENILYKRLGSGDIACGLFDGYRRYQEVKRCWRKENGAWVLKDISFIDDWSEEELAVIVDELKETAAGGGAVFAAFENGVLAGFSSLENKLFGSSHQYLQLPNIHVSLEHRGKGIGKTLFSMSCCEARRLGAGKLYISAHSAEESQAFYKAMGCVEALEYNQRLAEKEPCDCQMEFVL